MVTIVANTFIATNEAISIYKDVMKGGSTKYYRKVYIRKTIKPLHNEIAHQILGGQFVGKTTILPLLIHYLIFSLYL